MCISSYVICIGLVDMSRIARAVEDTRNGAAISLTNMILLLVVVIRLEILSPLSLGGEQFERNLCH